LPAPMGVTSISKTSVELLGQCLSDMNSTPMANALILDRCAVPCGEQHCVALAELLGRSGFFRCFAEPAGSPSASISLIPDLVLVRVSLDAEGEELIARCKTRWRDVSIVVIICRATDPTSAGLHSLLESADDFLYCSAIERELLLRSKRLLGLPPLRAAERNQKGQEFLATLPLVGRSPSFLEVAAKAAQLANADAAVLISGETGSGKELIARAIHYHGARRSKPFIPVNCGALPDHLFENELFGHVKGAFTDASSAEKGLIAEAEAGTLFLDEIDALSPAAQVKLLRFLQNGEYRPLGSSRPILANVRVIAASNSDLRGKLERKHFREDLFYRLNILSVAVPALRERGDDVLTLAEHFLDLYVSRQGCDRPRLSDAARQKLLNYSWPGNVRELEGVMQRAIVLNTSGILHAADIELPEGRSKELLRHESLRRAKSFVIGEFERSYVANLLATHQGNITQAAKAAGKDRRTLQRLVRKYALNRVSFKS
jgi:two-component system, NtrC family, response regulator GlrR